jgi:hypothetical protein
MALGVPELGTRAVLFYNLSGVEARLGRRSDALTHLEEALMLNGQLKEQAIKDVDFEGLRQEDLFQRMTAT